MHTVSLEVYSDAQDDDAPGVLAGNTSKSTLTWYEPGPAAPCCWWCCEVWIPSPGKSRYAVSPVWHTAPSERVHISISYIRSTNLNTFSQTEVTEILLKLQNGQIKKGIPTTTKNSHYQVDVTALRKAATLLAENKEISNGRINKQRSWLALERHQIKHNKDLSCPWKRMWNVSKYKVRKLRQRYNWKSRL